MAEFTGTKICQDTEACVKFRDLCKVEIAEVNANKILVDKPGVIGSGGNSGFQALNLVVQFGAMRILLVGFDMHAANGVHWHGEHGRGLNNPRDSHFMRWRQAFGDVAKQLRVLGVDVVNASPQSALTVFPKMSVEDAMKRWGL